MDLSPIELFKTYSGTSYSHDTLQYTDQTYHFDTNESLQSKSPYLNSGQTDVIGGSLTSFGGLPNSQDPLAFDLTQGADPAAMSTFVNTAIAGIIQGQAFVGSLQNEVDGSKALNKSIIDALTSGVGSLVDADMNEASTRLNALQTQQQLGTQALSVANDNSQMILKLFGG